MDIVIDLSPIHEFASLPLDVMAIRLFFLVGWIPIAIAFLWGVKEMWLFYIRQKWVKNVKFILLAIDIPRGNQQTPKAVENIFAYLAGAHGSINLVEKYWEGIFQLSFSLEIVSIDGYTQFLIHTPAPFRDLVESAVYSQYPDAEITEVNDYAKGMPTKFPDEEYDVWGCEFIQNIKSAYPIKTYEDFEHQMGVPEEQFKDPMATLMDLCSSLRKGEQLWYQIILIPIGFDWTDIGDKEISKILKEKTSTDDNFMDKIVNEVLFWMNYVSEAVFSLWGDIEEKEKKEDDTLKMMNLKPKEKKQIEAIQDKVSKLSFEFKIRFVYLAKKNVMNKLKVASGFVGYMKQYAHLDLNNLKPDIKTTATTTSYFFKESRLNDRKNRIVRNYIKRDNWAGKRPGILNIEELASVWHFPVEAVVKAPLIQKAPGRKAEPPATLPFGEETVSEEIFEPAASENEIDDIFIKPKKKDDLAGLSQKTEQIARDKENIFEQELAEKRGAPPGNLPVS